MADMVDKSIAVVDNDISPQELIIETLENGKIVKGRVELHLSIDIVLDAIAELKKQGVGKLKLLGEPKGTGDLIIEFEASPGVLPWLKDFVNKLGSYIYH